MESMVYSIMDSYLIHGAVMYAFIHGVTMDSKVDSIVDSNVDS